MAAFGPTAATAVYMATLSPTEHARATAYTQGGHWLLLWGTLVTIMACTLIARSGLLVRLRKRIERRRPRANLAVFACTLAFLALDFLIELPWSIYADWWREGRYGLTHQAFSGWLGENLLSTAINALFLALLALPVYALIRRRPRSWWAWSGLVSVIAIVLLVIVSPVLIEPLFNNYIPAPPGPTRDVVVTLAKRTGVPSDKIFIYDGSRQSDRYTANVSGLFGTARVAMSDTMFKQGADFAEVRAVVGHEMGHYVHGHAYWLAGAMGLLAALGFYLTDRLFSRTGLRIGGAGRPVPTIGDPVGIPVLALIFAILGLLATPLTNTFTRVVESDADKFSLANAHEPDGLSRSLVKTIAYRASSPSPIEEAIFYDHPSVERRVHRAMVWKAQHPDLVGM